MMKIVQHCPSRTKRSSRSANIPHVVSNLEQAEPGLKVGKVSGFRLCPLSSLFSFFPPFVPSRRGKDAESLKLCCHVGKVSGAKEIACSCDQQLKQQQQQRGSNRTQLVLINDRASVCPNWLHVCTFSQFLGSKEAGEGKFPVRFYCDSTSFF